MLYKRVQRSLNAPYGVEPVPSGENPFLDGPCLLCLAAQPGLKYNNGILRKGMKYARIRTSEEDASGVCAQDTDVTFCTYDREHDKIENLFNTYFLPIIESINDKEKLAKIFRNINIMSYCGAFTEVEKLLKLIEEALKGKGLSPEDINGIMKNIVCIQITGHFISNSNATTIMVGDRQDFEGGIHTITEVCDKLADSQMEDHAVIYSEENKHILAIDKNDIHRFDYMEKKEKGEIMRAILPTLVSRILENSRQNAKSERLIPLDMSVILSKELQTLMQDITVKRITSDEVLEALDQEVFEGSPRASEKKLGLLRTADTKIIEGTKIIKQLQEKLDYIPLRVKDSQSTREKFIEALRRLVDEETLNYIISGEGNPEEIKEQNSRRIKTSMNDDVKARVYDLVRSYSSTIKSFAEQERQKGQKSVYEETALEGVPDDCREIVDELQKMVRVMYEKKEALIKNEKEALDEEEITRELIKRITEVVPPDVLLEMIQVVDPGALRQCTLISEYLEEKAQNGEVEM